MKTRYTDGFKQQAVEKALLRGPEVTMTALAEEWGIGYSTLTRWISESKTPGAVEVPMSKHRSDCTAAERLEAVIACDGLDETELGAYCREKGIYPHQVVQWKSQFVQETTRKPGMQTETKQLKQENKGLKKELRRKEKALAEVAALLVLQKKVDAMWRGHEDD